MNVNKFIDECKVYFEKKSGIPLTKILDFNEDTLYCDDCDNFYGYVGEYKDNIISLMNYEEDYHYFSSIISTVDKESENIGLYEHLVASNNDDLTSLDLDKAKKIIDAFIENLEEL